MIFGFLKLTNSSTGAVDFSTHGIAPVFGPHFGAMERAE